MKYTEEKLNGLDKETLIQLFLSQQEQLERIDHTLQLVLEQMSDLKRHRFGRSTEKHEIGEQISFMEVDGNIVFFNEAYTTNAVESVNFSLRKVTKKGAFPNENALFKLLYLRITELYKKWNGRPLNNWALVRNRLDMDEKIQERIRKYENGGL